MSSNFAVAETLADRLIELGGISADRVRMDPPPGTARIDDLLRINEARNKGLFELIDGCLEEKAVGYEASVVAAAIVQILRTFVSARHLGLASGPDGFFKLLSTVRGRQNSIPGVIRGPGFLDRPTGNS